MSNEIKTKSAEQLLSENWINQKGNNSYEWVLSNVHIIKAIKEYGNQFKSHIADLESQNQKYREVLEDILERYANNGNNIQEIVDQATKYAPCNHKNSVWNSNETLKCKDCGTIYKDEPIKG